NAGSERLKNVLEENTSVRRALLGMISAQPSLSDVELRMAVVGHMRACDYHSDDIKFVGNPRLERIYKKHLRTLAAERTSPKVIEAPRRRIEQLDFGSKEKKYLRGMLPSIRDGSAIDVLVSVANRLPTI